MAALKVLIIYYSSTGTNYQLSKWAKASAEEEGAEVKIVKAAELAPQSAIDSIPQWKKHLEQTQDVPDATLKDLEWADAIIFSTPTRYGALPAQLKQFIDSTGELWQKGKLKDKVVTAMSSAINPHGGQEETILSLYTTMYHWGAIVVAPGYTDPSIFKAGGNPYGTSVSVDEKGNMREDKEVIREAVQHQARRLVEVANKIKIEEEQFH